VTISATPISTGYSNGTVSQLVVIHLVPVGVILPPADTPTASFVITPLPVSTGVATNFDASASCPGSAAGTVCSPSNNTIDSYSWGFGDGGAATGRATSHFYTVPGIYTVTLTVTNNGGKSASATQSVTVAASTPPTGNWTFSAVPTVGVPVIFNATTIVAAPGHPIGRWDWDFGDIADRTPGSGPVTTHTFNYPNTYEVILSVTDDRGLTTVFPQSVVVK
jgi:chitinase